MQNVEFKAELREPKIARAIARSIGARLAAVVDQRDTYYRVTSGRLKKRESSVDGEPEPVEIIQYHRDNRTQPKISKFTILSEDEAAERFGTAPLPEWLVVEKRREIFLKDEARIHIDEVAGLGWFLEFEVLVTPKQNVARAHEALGELRREFSAVLGEPISVSYSDLVDANHPADEHGA